MSKLTKNYIYNLIYQLFLLMVPILTAPYLARVLGATHLGIYVYVNSVSSIIITIGIIGLNNYGIRQIAYHQNDMIKRNEIFWEIMFARFFLASVISIFYFFFITNSEYSSYFLLQYFLILAVFFDVSWFLIGLENMGIVVLRNFIAKLLTVIGIFLLVKEQEDLWIYIGLFSIITFLTTISLYPYISRYISWYRVNFKGVLSHFIPSLLLFLPQVATLLYLQVDKIMLKFMTSNTNQVAFYDQADKLIQIPLALITAVGTVMMPRLAFEFKKENYALINKYLDKTLLFVLFFSFPLMFGLAAIAPTLIPWYLGKEFLPVISAIIILSPIIILNSLNNISGTQYFTATNQVKILTFAYVSAAVFNIIINALLIPEFGYKGAAVATLFSSFLSVSIQYFFLIRQIAIFSTLLKSFKYMIVGGFMGIIVYIVGHFTSATPTITIIQVVIGIFVYLVVFYIKKDEILLELYNKVFRGLKQNGFKRRGN